MDPAKKSDLPGKRVTIHVPSHREVNESRSREPTNLFRQTHPSPETLNGPNQLPKSAASFTEVFGFVQKSNSPNSAHGKKLAELNGNRSQYMAEGSKQENGSALATGLSANQIRNAIVVSRRQQGNPVLKHIRNVRWIFGDVVPDYLLGNTTCALYISLRYHLLHPEYLHFRIRELQKAFRLRVVLCHVDLDDVIKPLNEITKTALLNECTLLCAMSVEECARYLETLKTFENKPSDAIQERVDNDYISKLTNVLTSVRRVNGTDALTLGIKFGSLAEAMGASMEDLSKCPGIGERKVKRLYDCFHEPFRRKTKQLRLMDTGILPMARLQQTPLVDNRNDSGTSSKQCESVEGISEPKPAEPSAATGV